MGNRITITALHTQSSKVWENEPHQYLSKIVSEHQRDWNPYLPLFLMVYRSAVHKAIEHILVKMLFGRQNPSEALG